MVIVCLIGIVELPALISTIRVDHAGRVVAHSIESFQQLFFLQTLIGVSSYEVEDLSLFLAILQWTPRFGRHIANLVKRLVTFFVTNLKELLRVRFEYLGQLSKEVSFGLFFLFLLLFLFEGQFRPLAWQFEVETLVFLSRGCLVDHMGRSIVIVVVHDAGISDVEKVTTRFLHMGHIYAGFLLSRKHIVRAQQFISVVPTRLVCFVFLPVQHAKIVGPFLGCRLVL